MSKSITIPQIGADPLIVVIDGNNPQKFQAGETYTVADDVAEIINNLIASFPQEAVPTEATVVAPIPTVADAGKAVVVGEDGKYKLGEGGGGGSVVVNGERFVYYDAGADVEYDAESVSKSDLESFPLAISFDDPDFNYRFRSYVLGIGFYESGKGGWYATSPEDKVTVSASEQRKFADLERMDGSGNVVQMSMIYDSTLDKYYRFFEIAG